MAGDVWKTADTSLLLIPLLLRQGLDHRRNRDLGHTG
jgi:hypothetical protein